MLYNINQSMIKEINAITYKTQFNNKCKNSCTVSVHRIIICHTIILYSLVLIYTQFNTC